MFIASKVIQEALDSGKDETYRTTSTAAAKTVARVLRLSSRCTDAVVTEGRDGLPLVDAWGDALIDGAWVRWRLAVQCQE